MKKEFSDFPAYADNYKKAFDRAVKKRKAEGKPTQWETGEDVFNWWIGNDKKEEPQIDGQLTMKEG